MKFLIVSALMVLAVNGQYSSGGGAKPAGGAAAGGYGGASAGGAAGGYGGASAGGAAGGYGGSAGQSAGGSAAAGGYGGASSGSAAGGAAAYGGASTSTGGAAGGAAAYGGASGSAGGAAGAAGAAPIGIIKSVSDINLDGSFSYSYETENGIKAEASGQQKQVGPKPEDIGSVQKGSYSYTSPEGQLIKVDWIADENGFQPTGDHLPTPPPMPAHVVKMLADLKASGALNENGTPNTGYKAAGGANGGANGGAAAYGGAQAGGAAKPANKGY